MLAAASAVPLAFLVGAIQPAELYIALALIIIAKHYANIGRLLRGEEAKVGAQKAT
jgi:glycerol-3-phosphate acyltransferase PlsY